MHSKATTIDAYLEELDPEKAELIRVLLTDIRSVIDPGFEEAMNWGMISWQVPLSLLPKTYNQQPLLYCALAAQKRYCAIYLMCAYGDSQAAEMIRNRYQERGLKLNMGKSCLRFNALEKLDRDIVKEVIALYDVEAWVTHYQECRRQAKS